MSQITRTNLGTGAAPIEFIDIDGTNVTPDGAGGVYFESPTLTVVLGDAANTVYFDLTGPNKMGFGLEAFAAGAPYLDYTSTIGQVDVIVDADCWVGSAPVSFTAPQSVTGLTTGNAYWIYVDNTGTLQKADISTTIFSATSGAVLYAVYRDATPGVNEQYCTQIWQDPTASAGNAQIISDYLGFKITLTSGSEGYIEATGGNKITLSEGMILQTPFYQLAIADPGGVALTWNVMYQVAGGMATAASTDTFTAVYNNFGVGSTALTAGYFGVYSLWVTVPDSNTANVQYFAVMDRTEYATEQEALFAISREDIDTIGGLGRIGMARLGYIVISQATGNISRVVVDRESVDAFPIGTSKRDAIMLPTYTTNFNHILSATDTTVQAALDTIDDLVLRADGPTDAQAASAVFTLAGGNNIGTAAAGSTVTINVNGTTDHAIQLGNATNSLSSLALGSAGQLLVSQGAGSDPTWTTSAFPTTAATGDIIYASAANTLSMRAFDATATRYLANTGDGGTTPTWDQVNLANGVTGTLPVANGGTGATTLTDHGVLVGSGVGAVTVLGVGLTAQVLKGNTGADPSWGAVDLTTDVTGYLPVGSGGTGVGSITAHALVVGDGTNALNEIAVGATGQGLMGNTGADPSWTGSPSFSGTVTGGTGITATTGNIVCTAGNVTLPSTAAAAGQLTINGSAFVHGYGSYNTFAGHDSGNFTLSGTRNTGLGHGCLLSLTSGTRNVAVGRASLTSLQGGSYNSALNFAGENLTSGDYNTALGYAAMNRQTTGSYNLMLGQNSGVSNTTVAASSNIYLQSVGAVGESNTMRLGDQGSGNAQIDTTYMAGVYQTTVGATHEIMTIDSNYKVGTLPASEFFAYLSSDDNNVTGSSEVATIKADSELYDTGGDYDNTTWTYTAPVDGYFIFGMHAGIAGLSSSSQNQYRSYLITTDNTYISTHMSAFQIRAVDAAGTSQVWYVYMDEGDTAYFAVSCNGGSTVVDIKGSSLTYTYIYGALLK